MFILSSFLFLFHLICQISTENVGDNRCVRSLNGNHCMKLHVKSCLTGNLTHNSTSSILVSSSLRNDVNLYEKLFFWENLKNIPKCWEVVKPILCSIHLPRCEWDKTSNVSSIQLPGKELCEIMKEPCKIVDELRLWPTYLRCNHSHYAKGCLKSITEVKFNSTGHCVPPLIKTNYSKNWFPGFEGCSLSCANPWFDERDHAKVHLIVIILGICCLACNFFVVFTFSCNWKHLNVFPDNIVLYINVCYMVASCGWLIQFIPGVRSRIACKLDGTQRKMEQFKSDESLLCIFIFVLVYFFTLASVAWFVVLSYTWQVAFETSRNQVRKKKAYFHIGVWVLSFVLTILCLVFTGVDGDTLTGVCFIGFENFYYRGMLVLTPIIIAWIAGLAFLMRGLLFLINMKSQSPDLLTKQKQSKLQNSTIRIGVFAFVLVLLGVLVLSLHIHAFTSSNAWRESMKDYVICRSNITGKQDKIDDCLLENKPSILVVQMGVFCFFAPGILMSSWLWKMAALKSWKHCFKRKLKQDCVCNKARGSLQRDTVSVITGSESEDLIGMNFDLNSMTSFDVSSLSSILTPTRRFSESDVSSFGRIEKCNENLVSRSKLKEGSTMITNQGSSLSSSEWSTGESQKSHISIEGIHGGRFDGEELCNVGKKFYRRKWETANETLMQNISNVFSAEIIESRFQISEDFVCLKDANYSTNSHESRKIAKVQNTLRVDLQSFRTRTNALYDTIDEKVECSVDSEEYEGESEFNVDDINVSDDCETIDSSNSNYTLASSDTAVLSIKLDENYQPIINSSVESMNYEHSRSVCTESSEDISPSRETHFNNFVPQMNEQKDEETCFEFSNLSRYANEMSTLSFTVPLRVVQFWSPYSREYPHLYSNELTKYCLMATEDFQNNQNIIAGKEYEKMALLSHYKEDMLNGVEVFSLEDSSSENLSLISFEGVNDGDESGNVSDTGNISKTGKKKILLKRKKGCIS